MTARLYYLDDIPTPYRLGVHRQIAANWTGPFKLAFCSGSEPGREWDLDLSGLDAEILAGVQYRPKMQRNPFSFKWNPKVIASITKFNPDVVVLSGYVQPTMQLVAWWCRLKDKPYGIASETSWRSSVMSGWRWHLKKILFGSAISNMAFGLPVGREAEAYLRAMGAKTAPMYYFPNTPDAATIAAAADQIRMQRLQQSVRRNLGLRETGEIVLFVGRLIQAKRPLELLAAFQRIQSSEKNPTLVFVGDGALMPQIKAAAADDPRIVCLGWIKDQQQLISIITASSFLVLPSEHEPWGAVVNEAMACSIPVIASDRVGAAVELIESGSEGFVYPLGDVAQLSEFIRELIENKTLRAQMGHAAGAKAKAYGHLFAARNLVEGASKAARDF